MFKFMIVRGASVPPEARELSRGPEGCLMGWYDRERDNMVATLLYRGKTLIGWCCAIRKKNWLGMPSKVVEIGTFVDPQYRGKGFARKLLDKTCWMLQTLDPETEVRYGAPEDDAGYFNKTYLEIFKKRGLTPIRYFARA